MVYPSIKFTTSRRNAIPTNYPWRDAIAIVGEFSKGPTELINVTGENFELFFGNDSTEGSASVQQALELGAANIWVSRAVPEDTPSTGSIYVASANTNGYEPTVGYEVTSDGYNPVIDEDNYTVGVSLQVEYISEPRVIRTLVAEVSTKPADLDHPSFNDKDEQGEVIFTIVDFKDGVATPAVKHDIADSLTVKTVAGAVGVKQVVAISKTDSASNAINSIDQVILPGYVFSDGSIDLRILTKPFNLSSTHWGVLVENLSITTATSLADVQVFDPAESVYIIGYRTNIIEAGAITTRTADTSYVSLGVPYVNEIVSEPQDGFFAIKSVGDGGVWKEFKYSIVGTSVDTTDAYVLGSEGFSASSTEGIQLLFGTEGDSVTPLPMLIGGQFSVLFANGYALAGGTSDTSADAFTVGIKGKAVMSALYNAINNSSTMNALLTNLQLAGTYFPYGVIFDTTLVGEESTRLKYKLTRHVKGATADATDLYFDVNKVGYETGTDLAALPYAFVSGGYSGPTYAETSFYGLDGTPLLRVQALSPGSQSLKVTLTNLDSPAVDHTQMVLTISGTYNNKPYTDSIRLDTRNINPDTGVFTQSQTSAFVRVFFTPYLEYPVEVLTETAIKYFTSKVPARVAPPLAMYSNDYAGAYAVEQYGPAVLRDVALTGGSDYTQTTPPLSAKEIRKRAYLAAVRRLASVDAAFVGISGISYGDPFYAEVFDEAIEQTKNADVETGLRQLFLQTPANMPAKRAQVLSDEINHPFVSLINGSVVQALPNGGNRRQIGVVGYYMGLLATRPPHISPHASYNGVRINSIVSSTVKSTKEFKTDITLGRTDTIYFDNGLQTWKFLNGLTTSSVYAERYVSVNRIRMQIISDLYINLQGYRSQPNTETVRNEVTSAVNAYMTTKLQQGWLAQLGAIISDETNNSPSDIARGIINVSIQYLPVLPADFINVDLIEDYTLIDTLALVPVS